MSDAHDRKLLLTERLALRGHLFVCSVCPKLHAQLKFVINASRRRGDGDALEQAKREVVGLDAVSSVAPPNRLSDLMKERLRQRIAQATSED